jgi:PhnB protein
MASINPHINFNGNAEEAFTFYKSVFGGEFAKVIRFKDLTISGFSVEKKEENKIMHIALPIGNSNMLIANDVTEVWGAPMKMRTEVKLQSALKAEKKLTNYFMDFRPEDK